MTNGSSVTYITPQCASGATTDGCISLIRASGANSTVYKILNLVNVESRGTTLLVSESDKCRCDYTSNLSDPYRNLQLDNLRRISGVRNMNDLIEQIVGLDFYLSVQCQMINEVYYYGKLIGERVNGRFEFVEGDPIPIFIPPLAYVIVDIFERGGFTPIAGANPPASELAAQNVFRS